MLSNNDLLETEEEKEASKIIQSLANFKISSDNTKPSAAKFAFRTPVPAQKQILTTNLNPFNKSNQTKSAIKAGEVRFGEFKARRVPKSTYERPSKRKAAKQLINKSGMDAADQSCFGGATLNVSGFHSCSEDDEAIVSVLGRGDTSAIKNESAVNYNTTQEPPKYAVFRLGTQSIKPLQLSARSKLSVAANPSSSKDIQQNRTSTLAQETSIVTQGPRSFVPDFCKSFIPRRRSQDGDAQI